MLIKITKSCHNGCIHCCNDSMPSNKHMSIETFKAALSFAEKYDSTNIIGNELAGGEPTEHPQFFELLDIYYEKFGKNKPLTVATNGHFLIEQNEQIHLYLEKYPNLSFQVTYDNRYYPKKLDITKRVLRHKRIIVVTEVSHIFPKGRAITNNLKISDKVMCPPCYNLRLILEQLHNTNLKDLILTLRNFNKYCIPCIQYDGSLGFGEYDSCPNYCSIYDSEEEILNCIRKLECEDCREAIEICNRKILDGTLKIKKV